jgi:hypothetical protein
MTWCRVALATDPAGIPRRAARSRCLARRSFQLLPYNPGDWRALALHVDPAVGGLTFPWIVPQVLMRMDRVQITGVYGWPAVPQVIRQMSLQVASEIFRSKDMTSGGGAPGEFAVALITSSPLLRQAADRYVKYPFLAA